MGNNQTKKGGTPTNQRSIRFSEDYSDSERSPVGNTKKLTDSSGRSGARAFEDGNSTPTPSLHDNLLRERTNHDPMAYYDVVQMLGEGSMGSVTMVKKRAKAVGGSARSPHNSVRLGGSKDHECNLPILLGGLLRRCLGGGGGGRKKKRDALIISNHPMFQGDQESSARTENTPTSSRIAAAQRQDSMKRQDSSSSSVTISRLVKKTGKYQMFFALKTIHLSKVADIDMMNEMRNEIELLKMLDHPHIVKAHETFDFRGSVWLVLEFCSGGDLYSRDPYTEEEASRIIYSILSAVAYLHSKNIIHRDLKYENIMFANSSPRSEIKLIDFGLSKKYGKEKSLHDGVGTIYTMAPQVLQGKYDSQADLWSVGVLAFMALSSMMPFYGKDRVVVMNKILNCDYRFKGRKWRRISPQAKNFVEELLQYEPDDRPTAEEALQFLWLNRRFAASVRSPDEEVLDRIQATLETYAGYSKLKKLALMLVAHKSTSEEVGILRKVWKEYDINGDGKCHLSEFKQALSAFGYTDAKAIERMFIKADLDGTGVITYTEFLAATIEAHGWIDEERIAEAFDQIDEDDSGYITAKNLRKLLGKEVSVLEINNIIAHADLLHDNRISYDEFLALWDEKEDSQREKALLQLQHRRSSMAEYSEDVSDLVPGSVSTADQVIVPSDSEDLTVEEADDSLLLGVQQFSEKKQLSTRQVEEKQKAMLQKKQEKFPLPAQ